MNKKKAVVLVSGGLDSATLLFYLKQQQEYELYGLTFDYGQRHKRELEGALKLLKKADLPYNRVKIEFPWKGSALTDQNIQLPKGRSVEEMEKGIPATYVPARNLIFLSLAAGYAEAIGAEKIFYGANSLDYSGYPDCRPEFIDQLNQTIRVGTKIGVENDSIRIEAPLVDKTKAEIVQMGQACGVPFQDTWSCYAGEEEPCGVCDSCFLREKGFKEAGVEDPIVQQIKK